MSDEQEIMKVNIIYDKNRQRAQDEYIIEKSRKKLRLRTHFMWGLFFMISVIGMAYSFIECDVTLFGRSGSIGVVLGIFFARMRYNIVENIGEYSERSMMNPISYMLERLSRQLNITIQEEQYNSVHENQKTLFSRDEVNGRVKEITKIIDGSLFFHEALIISLSTIIWGYGDFIVKWIMSVAQKI